MRTLPLLFASCLLSLGSCGTHRTTPASRSYHSLTTRFNALYNAQIAFDDGYTQLFSLSNQCDEDLITTYPLSRQGRQGEIYSGFEIAEAKVKRAIQAHSLRTPPEGEGRECVGKREYNPSIHQAWFILGQAQLFSGKVAEALETFSYIAQLFDNNLEIQTRAKLWLLRSMSALKLTDDARVLYQSLAYQISQHTRGDKKFPHLTSITLAEYYLLQGDTTRAIVQLERATEKAPYRGERSRLHYLLGQLYATRGEQRQAISAWRTASELTPSIFMELSSTLRMLELSDDKPEELTSQLRSLANRRRYREYRDIVYWTLGRLEQSWGNLDTAEGYWLEALANTTTASRIYINVQRALGAMYLQQYQWLLACQHYRQLLTEQSLHQDDSGSMPPLPSIEVVDSLAHWIKIYETNPSEDLPLLKQPRDHSQHPIRPTSYTPLSTSTRPMEASTGYFDNPRRLDEGRIAFAKRWGNRLLNDRWRTSRAQGSYFSMASNDTSSVVSDNEEPSLHASLDQISTKSSLPSLDGIEEAMWHIAQILYRDFGLLSESKTIVRSMIKRFPNGTYAKVGQSHLDL